MPGLDLNITATTGREFVPFLTRKVRLAHGLLKTAVHELSLVLVGDRRMSELHKTYMHLATPTDVLTFPLETDRYQRVLCGEVVVCVPVARRRAREMGHSERNELLLYALHGLLHLSGWDDRTQRQYQRMHQMEDRILRRLEIGPVFAPRSAKGRR